MSPHPIVHIEFAAKDPTAAGSFYAQVFGWETTPMPRMNYVTFEAKPGPAGGFAEVDGRTYKAGDVIAYVQTDDIDATLAEVVARGGRILQGKSDIAGIGWFAFFADPSGNRVGLFTPVP